MVIHIECYSELQEYCIYSGHRKNGMEGHHLLFRFPNNLGASIVTEATSSGILSSLQVISFQDRSDEYVPYYPIGFDYEIGYREDTDMRTFNADLHKIAELERQSITAKSSVLPSKPFSSSLNIVHCEYCGTTASVSSVKTDRTFKCNSCGAPLPMNTNPNGIWFGN